MIDVRHLSVLLDQVSPNVLSGYSLVDVESWNSITADELSREPSCGLSSHVIQRDGLLGQDHVLLLIALFVRLLRLRPIVLIRGIELLRQVVTFVAYITAHFEACLVRGYSFPLVQLCLQFGLTLVFTFYGAALLLSLLFHLGKVILLGLSLSFDVEGRDHLVVVTSFRLLGGCLDEVLLDDPVELLVALVEDLGGDNGHIWLVEEEPVGVFALENGKIRVEKGSESLKLLLVCHL